MKTNKCSSENNKSKLLYIITFSILGILMIIDSKNIINHIYAGIFILIINKFLRCDFRKTYYFITLTFAIMTFTVSIPLGKEIGSEQINIYYIYLFIYLIVFLVDKVRNLKKNKIFNIKFNFVTICAGIFVIYIFISLAFVQNYVFAIKKIIFYCIMFTLVLMIINENKNKEDLKKTLIFLKYMGMGILLYGMAKIVLGVNIEPYTCYINNQVDMERLYFIKRIPMVFFYNPNDFAFVCTTITVGFITKFIYDNTKKEQIISLLFIILGIINLIFSSSRTGWIAYFATLIFMILLIVITLKWKMLKKAIIAVLLSCTIFYSFSQIEFFGPYYGKIRVLEDLTTNNNNGESSVEIGGTGSVNVRLTLITDVLEGVLGEKKLQGFGVGNTAQYYIDRNNTNGILDTHNWWFEILGDFGVIGFLSFALMYLGIFITLIMRIFKEKYTPKFNDFLIIVLGVSTALLVFGPSSVHGFVPFWILNALALITVNSKKQLLTN